MLELCCACFLVGIALFPEAVKTLQPRCWCAIIRKMHLLYDSVPPASLSSLNVNKRFGVGYHMHQITSTRRRCACSDAREDFT
jgi:hypothetical protein